MSYVTWTTTSGSHVEQVPFVFFPQPPKSDPPKPSPEASVSVKKPKPRPQLCGAVAVPQPIESDMQLVGIEFMQGATKQSGRAVATLETKKQVISVRIGWSKPVKYATFLRGIFKLADQGVAA